MNNFLPQSNVFFFCLRKSYKEIPQQKVYVCKCKKCSQKCTFFHKHCTPDARGAKNPCFSSPAGAVRPGFPVPAAGGGAVHPACPAPVGGGAAVTGAGATPAGERRGGRRPRVAGLAGFWAVAGEVVFFSHVADSGAVGAGASCGEFCPEYLVLETSCYR